MTILFCKWEAVALRVLLDAQVPVHVVLDEWDVAFGDIDEELLASAAGVYRVTNFDSIEQLTAVAVDLRLRDAKISRIASFAEFSQYGAGLLSTFLGVNPAGLELATVTRDKRAMKARQREAGVPCARSLSVPDADHPPTPAEVAETVGFPAVVKPVSGMNAMATIRVNNPEEYLAGVAALEFPPEIGSRQLIIEEYIDGAEFHCDAVWSDGEPWHFTVGSYLSPRLSTGRGVEASRLLDPEADADQIAAALALHRRVNEALGIRDGATHFEFFRRADGSLVASEVATRLGGGPLLEMVLARDGVDLRELWASQLLGGPRPQLPLRDRPWRHIAGINIPPVGTGTITRVPSADALDADPHVVTHHLNCAVGDEGWPPWTLPMVVGAASADELLATIERVRREYAIVAGKPA
jgi:biotin carboxylase